MSNALWQAVLGELEVVVDKPAYSTWFSNTRLIRQEEDLVEIGVNSIFAKNQIESKFMDLIKDVLSKNGVKPKEIQVSVSPQTRERKQEPLQVTDWSVRPRPKNTNHHLNSKYTFDNFVVGSSNELAYATAQAIAKDPGNKYNPFFVYGGVGLGKTHLIQAIGNHILSNNPDANIAYITSEQFATEFIAAILRKKTFSDRYRQADVLIIDDMQFIAGKEKTEEEFFHTFNTLHQANKQIIISSDKPPKAIPTIEERLRSRFEWGMTADIQAPDFETRMAIIQSKGRERGMKVPPEISEYFATHIQSNVRELEGALTKIIAHCEVTRQPLNINTIEAIMGTPTSRKNRLTDKQVVDRTAKFFGVSTDDLMGPRRERGVSEPRQIAMYLMRQELHLSFPAIAKAVGRKDHTTAMHSVNKIDNAITRDSSMRQTVMEIKEKLYA
ncbi:MAG: chromosomal replication initiator protein DnaA [Candidatus Saccharimonadales bacterium]